MKGTLSIAEARRVALRAQGFDTNPPAAVTMRQLRSTFAELGLVQIDSVNVLVRSHYLPLFSRLGPYRRTLLDEASYGRRRMLFEYWGHEASLVAMELFPLFRWRMARAERLEGIYKGLARFAGEQRRFIEDVFRQVERRGPLGAGDLEKPAQRGPWWGWTQTKSALEYLFWTGRVTTASRRGFERLYDLTERVIPPQIFSAPVPDENAAQRALVRIAARALGVATERDLRDYFRLPVADTKLRIAELVDSGDLAAVDVEHWKAVAYMPSDASVPRAVHATALLSPFDSLVWERDRTHRLFDFHYRLEIYTPAHKRVHGYYVLPFLWNGRLVARVDLKADRARDALMVRGVNVEAGIARREVLSALKPELEKMRVWLALGALDPLPAGRRPSA